LGPRAGLTGAEHFAPIGIWAWDRLKSVIKEIESGNVKSYPV